MFLRSTYLDYLMTELKRCQLNNCKRVASALCYCCQKSICIRHFNDHIDILRADIVSLTNTVNDVIEKIQAMTIEELTETAFSKLNQWKYDMHQSIDQIFSNKHKEIEELIEKNKENFVQYKNEQKDNVMKIQEEVKQLVEDGDVTFQEIESLKNRLARIRDIQSSFEKNFLSVQTQVSSEEMVIVSSNLNNSNTLLSLSQCSITSNPVFGAVKDDIFLGSNASSIINSRDSNIFSFNIPSTTTRRSELLTSPNPFQFSPGLFDERTRARSIVKARRLAKP